MARRSVKCGQPRREAGGLLFGQAAVDHLHLGSAGHRAQAHLDRARARGQALGSRVAPADEQAVGRVDLEVGARGPRRR